MKPLALLTPHHIASLKPRDKEYAVDDAQCAGLRLRILPGGTKSWVIFKRIDGRPRRITLGHWPDMTLVVARAMYYAREAELASQTGILAQPPRTVKFAALATQFLQNRAIHFKPSTFGPFRSYLESELLPAFGHTQVGSLKPADVALWFHRYSQLRPGGANQALGHFTTIVNWGKAEGHLPHDLPNPASPIRKNRSTARGQMLNFAQIRALARVLDKVSERHWLPAQAVRLCLLTGCRKGEILSLRWTDVKAARLVLRDAKSGPREVMLNAPARTAIAQLKHRTGRHAHLFHSETSKTGHLTDIATTWATLRTQANLPPEVRLHDLRHTYASHAILSGESLPTTGRLLGHASARTTERYAHLDGSALTKAADKVAGVIQQMMLGEEV
jgi:integrase